MLQFTNLAPDASRALNKFIELDSGKEDYKSLDTIITILENLGCNRKRELEIECCLH